MSDNKYLVHLKALEEKLSKMTDEEILELFKDVDAHEPNLYAALERYILNSEDTHE